MQALILILHVLISVSLIALILLQHGKGADAGAAFGSGASNTMFGSVGSLPFLTKLTAILAAIFFATSLVLSYWATPHVAKAQSNGLVPASLPQPETNTGVPELPTSTPVVPATGTNPAKSTP